MLDMVFNENYEHCNEFNAVSSPVQKNKTEQKLFTEF